MAQRRAGRLRVLKARAGRMVRGRFVAATRKNVAAGFHDEEGIFHPIRKSFDYDPARGGDARKRVRKRKPAAAPKLARKKARKKAKAKPGKKAKATKRKTPRKKTTAKKRAK
jgi:hypothetical protein